MKEFKIDKWLEMFFGKLKEVFGERILFAAHAGSWARGEATEKSDIDINLVLDKVETRDLEIYRGILKEMPFADKACGFICGRDEINAWPRNELFHFMNGCKIYCGSLDALPKPPTADEIKEYVRISSSAILHEARHLMIYSKDIGVDVEQLAMAYKSSFFIFQALLFLKDGIFRATKKEVMESLTAPPDTEVMRISCAWNELNSDRNSRPGYYFEVIIDWCSAVLTALSVDIVIE